MNHVQQLFDRTLAENNLEQILDDKQVGTIYHCSTAARVDWETAEDSVYDHFVHLSGRKFQFEMAKSERSAGFFILEIVIQNCSMDIFTPESIVNLSRVNKFFWNNFVTKFDVAFPPMEGLARGNKVSFDVFYFPTVYGKIHRLTLSRAHESTLDHDSFYICCLDSDIIYIIKKTRTTKTVILFKNERWQFTRPPGRATLYMMRICALTFDNTELLIHFEQYGASLFNFGYFPKRFFIIVNRRCITDGQKLGTHKKVYNCKNCLQGFGYCGCFLLLPLFIIFSCILLCFKACCITKKCKVRKYWFPLGARKCIRINQKKLKKLTLFSDKSVV